MDHLSDHPARLKWNRKYLESRPILRPEPASLLVDNAFLLTTSIGCRALDIACGNGTNSIFLESKAFDTDAVDISDIAISYLSREVRKSNLNINPIHGDLEQFELTTDEYDVIINFNYLQRSLFSPMTNALRAGGLLFFETMNTDHIDFLGHDVTRDYTLRKNELKEAFSSLEILHHKEWVKTIPEGKERSLTSMIARKVN